MTRFLLNEYYKWSPLHIFHLFLTWGVLALSTVILMEPITVSISAGLLVLVYFLVIVKSRFAYILNAIAMGTYAYALYSVGVYASAAIFGLVLFPLSVIVAIIIYVNKIYIEDHAKHIESRGFLDNRTFLIIALTMIVLVVGGTYTMLTYGIGVFPFLDIVHSSFYLLSVILTYYARYEHNITVLVADIAALTLWTLLLLTMGVGFSFILSTLIGFGSTRLLLVWWTSLEPRKKSP